MTRYDMTLDRGLVEDPDGPWAVFDELLAQIDAALRGLEKKS